MQKPRLGVLIHDGFPELDLWYPMFRLREEEAAPQVIGLEADRSHTSRLGYAVLPDVGLAEVKPADFDVLVLPGGEAGEQIAREESLVRFVAEAAAAGAVVAALSTARAALVGAGLLGAGEPAEGVAVTGRVITGGDADDLPAVMIAVGALLRQPQAVA